MATAKVAPVDTWPSFASYLLRRYDRFVSEQKQAWAALSELAHSVLETREAPGQLASVRTLAEAVARFERAGRRLLIAPYDRCGHLRPVARSLDAIEDLDRDVSAHAGGAEYVAGTRRATLLRARIDGAMQLLLSRTCLLLGQSWTAYLAKEVGLEQSPKNGTEVAVVPAFGTEETDLLVRYRQWTEDALIYLALHRDRARPRQAIVRKHQVDIAFWRARQHAVTAVVQLDPAIWNTTLNCLRATDGVVAELKREGDELRRRLQDLIRYMERWTTEPFDPPAINARIAGA